MSKHVEKSENDFTVEKIDSTQSSLNTSVLLDEEESEKNGIRKFFKRLKIFILARPVMVVSLFSIFIVFGIQGALMYGEYVDSTAEKARLNQFETTKLTDLKKMISEDKVDSVIRHSFFSQGLTKTRPQWFIEVKPKEGSSKIIEENSATTEEIWKSLVQLSFEHPFEVKNGYYSGSESLLQRGLQTVLFLGLILLLLVGAQKLTAEVLSGKNFRPKKPNTDIMFKDVVGIPQVKIMMNEIKDQLENKKGYGSLSIECPQGVLFVGDPGVGKTLLANAFANEAQADFFLANGSDFAEMFVGVGPKRIRSLFAEARQCSRAVIFIDEIDAIGSRDSAGLDSERRNTINALLSEMDGVEKNTNVLVIAATNHVDKLDKALLRRGRFDKIVQIPLPTKEDRQKILELNLKKVALDNTVDLDFMAKRTLGYSGATLAGIAADAKTLALRRVGGYKNKNSLKITQEDLLKAQEISILGEEGKTATGEELKRVAVHELGHALMGKIYCDERKHVEKVTLNGRGQALGYTASSPKQELMLISESEYMADLISLLGGRAAEQVFFNSISNGASDDLRRANTIASLMVTRFGMGKKTQLQVALNENEELSDVNKEDINLILNEAYKTAIDTLNLNKEWLVSKARLLEVEMELNHTQMFDGYQFLK